MYKDLETVDKLIEASREKKVLVLKHSSACPISARGKREFDSYLESNPDTEAYLVVVQQRRDISNEIEEKLGIRHETPQLLLIEDGKVSQHWSHHSITEDEIGAAMT